MGRHTAHATIPCPRCDALARQAYVADTQQAQLRVHESVHCAACGLSQEAHGPELGDGAREAFYASEGRWSIALRELGPRRLEALGALRAFMQATPAELKRVVDERACLLEGSLVEIELVAEVLGAAGAEVTITRVPCESTHR
jgi:hypothetical protein